MGNCRSTVIPPLRNHATKDIVVNESEKANALNNYVCSISSTGYFETLSEWLQIYFKGKYTVSAVFFSIWWLMKSPPDALPMWSEHLKKTVFVEISLVDLYYLLLKI
jgi:hypothetical protein